MKKSIHQLEYQKLIHLLRTKRMERGLTQVDVASRLGVPQALISKIETCERRLDVIELKEYCETLNIGLADFILEYEAL